MAPTLAFSLTIIPSRRGSQGSSTRFSIPLTYTYSTPSPARKAWMFSLRRYSREEAVPEGRFMSFMRSLRQYLPLRSIMASV